MSYITAIGTANPENKVNQSAIAEFMIAAMMLDDSDARKLRALYRATGIESRYSVLTDYTRVRDFEFYPNTKGLEPFPSTKQRSILYRDHALTLSLNAISNTLADYRDLNIKTITHLVVVSCTGMYAPGLDIDIVRSLGLSPNIQRLCINFMGCYAAFNALKLANNFCLLDKNAKVLIVCTELCSIHFQKENTEDNMLANALFADGSAAMLVEGKPRKGLNLSPQSFYCSLALDGAKDMAWTIGDQGFEMKLSSYIPEVVRSGIRDLTTTLLSNISCRLSDVSYFAIHPGGKKILEVIESELGLTRQQNVHSYNVLQNYGNMSSPTVLFVIKELCSTLNGIDDGKMILSVAFGPGLTLESTVLKIENY